MIIRDFNFVSMAIAPIKTDPKLIVDPDAVLARAVAAEFLKPKTRKRKINQRCGRVENCKLHARYLLDAFEFSARKSIPEFLGLFVLAGSNHFDIHSILHSA